MQKRILLSLLLVLTLAGVRAQVIITDTVRKDTIPTPYPVFEDTVLRITNLAPYFSVHVDSMLTYQLTINKSSDNYFWYIKNSPAGLKINKDNGLLSFKADKSFFISGKLKYDVEYPVKVGVQNLADPEDKVDTAFLLTFYNTEVINPNLNLSVASQITVDEGQPVNINLQCKSGNFDIDAIQFSSSFPITDYKPVSKCSDEFVWTPNYEFVKETDSAKVKVVVLTFVGSTRYQFRDTTQVRIIVRNALNYPLANEEYALVNANFRKYIKQLKYNFMQLDRRLKRVKNTRTTFDLTSASTALTGTILNTSSSETSKNAGKVLPSVGLALVPVKEATAPNKSVDQNQASLLRASIKRLEYLQNDYALVGDQDPNILMKTQKLKEEMKQSQLQLIDVPIDLATTMSEQELDAYFNSPKVNKKYRLK